MICHAFLLFSGPSNEQSLFGFTSPINAAASAAGNLTSDTAPNIQVDAHGDDTVARVLEWMHNEPAFEDMPWSELDSSSKIVSVFVNCLCSSL